MAVSYFNANPDVAEAYEEDAYGMTPQEFADFHYTNYGAGEQREAPAAAPAAPSDEQIRAFVEANIGNPALIAETAAQYGVSVADLSRATGYDSNAVVSYFQQADIAPPSVGGLNATKVEEPPPPPPPDIVEPPPPPVIVEPPPPPPPPEEPPPKEIVETNAPVDLGDGTFRTRGGTLIDKDGRPVTKAVDTTTATVSETTPAATTAATTTATTLPAITDYQGNQFDGAQVLTLARQISENAGPMSGGVFQTKGENIGFAASEANTLLGRTATASEQVLLDMARQLIQSGVTDLTQLQAKDTLATGYNSVFQGQNGKFYVTYANPNDSEQSTTRELTADEAAKIKTEEIMGDEDNASYVRKTIEGIVTGKALFAGDKMLTSQDAVDNPIAYTIGQTYAGKGGTNYQLKFDPTTGKTIVSANGFSTSDAGMIMPIIMIASNFLMPGVGSMLSSALLEAGASELVSNIVSKSIINGVTSGIMAEASGGDFGDGFLKGSITGAISAGVAPMISTALPSDLSPAMSTALTRAGTAAITALATGTDVGTAIGTQLLNSAVGTGLSSVTGEMGLSTADAKLLNSVLTPVVTQLVTNGNVNDATLMNAVMLAGSTILANTGSVTNTTNVTTEDDTSGGGLNLLARDASNIVGTGLGAVSTATGLLNKATSLTKPVTKVNTTRANLTGALRTNTPTTRTTTRTAAVKPAALGALNVAKKTMTAQQMSQLKASKPAAQVNVANLIPVKKPPQRVDVKTLIPVKTAQLPAGLNTKKMG